jgi:hypothetical protein
MLAPGEYLVIPPTADAIRSEEPPRGGEALPAPAPAPPKPPADGPARESFLTILLRALGAVHS